MRSRDLADVTGTGSRLSFSDRVARLIALRLTLLQAAVAVGATWVVVTEVLGHPRGFFGPVAALVTLGLTVGQRLRRALEITAAVTLGLALADMTVLLIGSGVWQIVAITLVAMSLAVLVGGGPLFVQQAAASAVLVVTLQPPTNGLDLLDPLHTFARPIDGLVGASIALILNFVLLPVNPLLLVRRGADPLVRELSGVLRDVADALDSRDQEAELQALLRARAIDPIVQRFEEALEIGRETAAVAPTRRRARGAIALISHAGAQLDLAVRNVRVLARAALRALEVDDRVPPIVVQAIRELADAVELLGPWLEEPWRVAASREPAIRAARTATAVLEETTNLSVSVMVAQVRSAAVDILRATGVPPDQALAMVRGTSPAPGAR
jgi:uncharacterized membrane protein YgaE (UPF0421/DUF939 family)